MLIDYEKLRHAIMSNMPERSEVLLIVDNQPDGIVRCKECKHRPHDKRGHGVSEDLVFPDDVCPFQCDDPWYSQYPADDFFCAKGESNNDKD